MLLKITKIQLKNSIISCLVYRFMALISFIIPLFVDFLIHIFYLYYVYLLTKLILSHGETQKLDMFKILVYWQHLYLERVA